MGGGCWLTKQVGMLRLVESKWRGGWRQMDSGLGQEHKCRMGGPNVCEVHQM